MDCSVVKGNLHGLMESCMKDNLQIIELQEKECISGLMVVNMKEKLKMD